jgi:hypothetical protein
MCDPWYVGGKQGRDMGEYDENIRQCRRWRDEAVQRLHDLDLGPPWTKDGIDVTDERKVRERHIIEQMDILIPIYEAHNAHRP